MTPEEARRAYQRAWRAKNKDKVRKYNQTRWERLAIRMEQESKQTASSDSEKEKQDGR